MRLAETANDWDKLNQELVTDKALRGRLFGVLGSSLTLGDHLVANPQSWHLLAGNVTLPPADEVRKIFAESTTGASDAQSVLRTLYRDRLLVLAGLDVASVVENEPVMPFVAIGEHLSDLADAALGAALSVATRSVCGDDGEPPRLAVIAMGKCGARELNYVSDVDVIFVAEQADAVTTRVAGEMMRFASDTFFEVDAALRPEGKHGQLVRTLESHVAYYQRWAKTWEFQALMKARPAAGDAELGRQYIDALMPMVWTACEREDFVPEVQAMRRRVESLVPADERARELKLGTGGLRDVEFAVQLLQLVHGRNDESLHVASTVDALAALGAGGYIGRDDCGQPDRVIRVPAVARTPAAAAATQAHAHAARRGRRRGDALAGARCPHEARRSARRAGGAARRAQAPEHARVAAARQALLSAAAGRGWPARRC